MKFRSQVGKIALRIPLRKQVYRHSVKWINQLPFLRPRRHTRPIVALYPEFTDEAEFLDAYYKARFFLPPQWFSQIVLSIAFTPSFSLALPSTWPQPEYVADIPLPPPTHVRIIREKWGALWRALLNSDYVFIWDWSVTEGWQSIIHKLAKFKNVDRHTNKWDGWTWAKLWTSLQSGESLEHQRFLAQEKFQDYVAGLPMYSKSYIFGTGPSLEEAWKYDFSDGYRIVCNTIVRNEALLDHIKPHFIVAADAIYHFGNTRHAYQFRRDLEKVLLSRDIYFLTQELFYRLFIHYHPSVAYHTIPLRQDLPGVHLDMKNQLAYTKMHNILNGLLLPLGSSLADEIYLLGFDGRAPGDTFFWSNASANSYEDLKPTIMAAHPAFFRDIDYEEYARLQSENAEKIMILGEDMGKRYYCLNQTYIPSLKKRSAVEPLRGK